MKKRIFPLLVSLFLSAYVLNFIWESLHAFYLYEDHVMAIPVYVKMVTYVSFMDSLAILLMYSIIALIFFNFYWLYEGSRNKVILFGLLGLFGAFLIEYINVYIWERWVYNDLMPTIFGIGLSPLLQLAVTGLVALWVTRRILN